MLGAVYIGFIHRSTIKGQFIPSGIGGELAEQRLADFLRWVSLGMMQRAWALRAAVIGLGIGVAMMPLTFIPLDDWHRQVIVLAASIAVVASPILELMALIRKKVLKVASGSGVMMIRTVR